MDTDGSDGETLELTTGEEVDVSVHDMVELKDVANVLHVAQGCSALDQVSHTLVGPPDSLGDLINVLRLDNSLEVIFQKLGEVVLQLGSTEVLDNVLPVRGVVVSTQVGLELATQNLEGGTLSNTVGSNKTEDLARSRHGKTMQLEAVGSISVGDLALEVGGQVDDGDGVEWALFGADTTTDTERLGDESKLGIGSDFNTELSTANDGARFFAFLTTFSRATLVAVDDSDTCKLVRHICD